MSSRDGLFYTIVNGTGRVVASKDCASNSSFFANRLLTAQGQDNDAPDHKDDCVGSNINEAQAAQHTLSHEHVTPRHAFRKKVERNKIAAVAAQNTRSPMHSFRRSVLVAIVSKETQSKRKLSNTETGQ